MNAKLQDAKTINEMDIINEGPGSQTLEELHELFFKKITEPFQNLSEKLFRVTQHRIFITILTGEIDAPVLCHGSITVIPAGVDYNDWLHRNPTPLYEFHLFTNGTGRIDESDAIGSPMSWKETFTTIFKLIAQCMKSIRQQDPVH